MVSQADRELISNFVTELRPYIETVNAGVQEFAQPNRDAVVVGQAVQALVMIRGAGQILMVDGLVSIAGWLTESFETIQVNQEIAPDEAVRRLSGLSTAMEDFLQSLDRGEDIDPIVLRAKTIYEAIPAFSGPLPGTGRLRTRTDLDALFGDDERTAPTDRIMPPEAVDTEKLGTGTRMSPSGPLGEIPEAGPTVPLQFHSAPTRPVGGEPARIVPIPPQPTEKLPEVDPELRAIFEDEALDIIGSFGDNIRILAASPDDVDAIERLNRAAHTLKGAANMTGFPIVGQIGAAIEHLMDEHIARNKPISREALELVAVSWKMLRAMMPHLNDLSGFTSPSNSVVQRANVLREQLAMADAEAETLSIDHNRYGRATSVVGTTDVAPQAGETPVEARPAKAEDTTEIPKLPEDDAGADAIVEIHDEPEDRIVAEEVVDIDAPANVDLQEVFEDVIVAGPVEESTGTPFWSAPEVDSDAQPVDEGQDEALKEDRPQSEPFWTPGTEHLLRSAVSTDQLAEELTEESGFIDDLDTEIHAEDSAAFFNNIPSIDEIDAGEPADDNAEWLTESDRPGTNLLRFDDRPQTEPFWGSLDDMRSDEFTPGPVDESVADAFFEPIQEIAPISLGGEGASATDAVPSEQFDAVIHAGEEDADLQTGFVVGDVQVEETDAATDADLIDSGALPPELVEAAQEDLSAIDVESDSSPLEEPQIEAEAELPDMAAVETALPPDQDVVRQREDGDLSEIMAAAVLAAIESPSRLPLSVLDHDGADDLILDEAAHPIEAEASDGEHPDASPLPEIEADHDGIDLLLEDDQTADDPVPGYVEEIEEGLLVDLDLEPFDIEDTMDRSTDDYVGEFPDVDDEELDRLVAEIEDDTITSPDWLDQVEPIDQSAEMDVEPLDTNEVPVIDATEDHVAAPAIESRSGSEPSSDTNRLTGTTTDTLRPGIVDIESILSATGSAALSSALLDMAFSAPVPEVNEPIDEPAPVSVFDESSERALEIEMFETFSLEASDHLEALGRAAMLLDRDPEATDPIVEIKRALHTLKGAASAADFDTVSGRAHVLEDSLANHERLGPLSGREFVDELLLGIDEIEAELARRKETLFGRSEEERQNPTLRIEIGRVDGLLNTVGEMVVNRSGLEERLDRLSTTLDDLSTAAARLQRSNYLLEREAHAEDAIGRLLRGELGSSSDPILISPTSHSDWDVLEMDRYTEFDRLIQQLAEVGADVTAAVGEISALRGDLDTLSTRQRRLTSTLQDELMDIRMVPIASLAPRLYRVVRRAAARREKNVSLVLEGGETPFDKLLLDTLSESLLHLLRNAVDHGIEDEQTRRRSGKPEAGTIRIRAFREGSDAVIEIIDDGAGIDHELVIERALEIGLITDGNMSSSEALSLLFEPGFTTRGQADDISGRGLGLDIVEQTVERYKGRVTVESVPGRGTVFSLRLPVMLSVIQAFLVTAGNGEFAIPVSAVDYVIDRVDQPLTQIGETIVIESADQVIPVVDIGSRLGRATIPVMERSGGWVMIAEVAGKRWALIVDDLHAQQEIVVKPMGRFVRSMPGIMGATILGHGDVALIVDVPTLLGIDTIGTRLSAAPAVVERTDALTEEPEADSLPASRQRSILIVDDSLSVRRVVSRIAQRHGWSTLLARDGAEALDMLDQHQVDVVLTDIEMPRMDGFELVSSIRSKSIFTDLPIVVLTSRSGEKHRDRAYSLGADGYLVKPFQEQELIAMIEELSHVPSR